MSVELRDAMPFAALDKYALNFKADKSNIREAPYGIKIALKDKNIV